MNHIPWLPCFGNIKTTTIWEFNLTSWPCNWRTGWAPDISNWHLVHDSRGLSSILLRIFYFPKVTKMIIRNRRSEATAASSSTRCSVTDSFRDTSSMCSCFRWRWWRCQPERVWCKHKHKHMTSGADRSITPSLPHAPIGTTPHPPVPICPSCREHIWSRQSPDSFSQCLKSDMNHVEHFPQIMSENVFCFCGPWWPSSPIDMTKGLKCPPHPL